MYEVGYRILSSLISCLMKNGIILLLAISLAFTLPVSANTTKPRSSTDQLRKEVAAHFKARDLSFMDNNVETVKVSFLINAKRELVISNVEGEDPDVCDYVKSVLNFKRVEYSSGKQLAKYAVEIRLVK